MTKVTSPSGIDVSQTALDLAADRLIDALGADAVLRSPEQVREYNDPYEGSGATEFQPSFVVQPASVDEVQAVLRIANELSVPVWTSSVGRNYGYGGSAPVVSGSIVLNLRRMKAVLEINEEGGYALIEPGVTFFDLYDAIKASGAKLWISVPDLGWGSVAGNALDHGMGSTVYGDHASAVHGMEVALPTGELLRTGFGASSATSGGVWNRHRRGFGPSLDSLFFQSNFGVVTKLGIWLMPEPETFLSGWILVQDEVDLAPLLDAMRPLMLEGTIQGQPLVMSALGAEGEELSILPLPARYVVRFSFYDHDALVDARSRIVRDRLAHLPRLLIEERRYPGNVDKSDVHPLDLLPAGIPNLKMIDDLRAAFGPGYAHMDFSAVIPFDGQTAFDNERLVREVVSEHGLTAAFAWIVGTRTLTGITMLSFDVNDAEQRSRAEAATATLARRATDRGWNEYRAHPSLIPGVVKNFDFGDHALYRTYGRIKDALDPAGILSPGNHGIWPTR